MRSIAAFCPLLCSTTALTAPEPSGVHGFDERVLVEGFHGQVPIWADLIRRLAG